MSSLKIDKKKLNEIVKFYCINYKDENRRDKMQKRWDILGLDLIFVDPVETNDKRLDIVREKYPNIGLGLRDWAIMLQHLDCLRDFLTLEQEYAIICEDDILSLIHI